MTFEVVAVAVALGILALDAALGAHTMLTGTFVAAPIIAAIGAGPRATARVLALSTALALVSGLINDEFGTVDHLTRMLPVVLGGALAVYVAYLRSEREQTAMRLETQYGVARTFTEASSLEESTARSTTPPPAG
jgi:phosphoserine phosphatase RsbU/P